MSEFSSGSLTLMKYKEMISEFSTIRIQDLNEDWFYFVTEDTVGDENTPDYVYKISKRIPVIYFYNFEDHGWGYSIVSEGQEVANVHVSYWIEDNLMMKLAEERYPDADLIEFLYVDPIGQKIAEEIVEEIQGSEAYTESIHEQFINRNLESFRLLEASDEQINRLRDILSGDYFMQLESKHELVEEFKEVLNIQEMSWMNADEMIMCDHPKN